MIIHLVLKCIAYLGNIEKEMIFLLLLKCGIYNSLIIQSLHTLLHCQVYAYMPEFDDFLITNGSVFTWNIESNNPNKIWFFYLKVRMYYVSMLNFWKYGFIRPYHTIFLKLTCPYFNLNSTFSDFPKVAKKCQTFWSDKCWNSVRPIKILTDHHFSKVKKITYNDHSWIIIINWDAILHSQQRMAAPAEKYSSNKCRTVSSKYVSPFEESPVTSGLEVRRCSGSHAFINYWCSNDWILTGADHDLHWTQFLLIPKQKVKTDMK